MTTVSRLTCLRNVLRYSAPERSMCEVLVSEEGIGIPVLAGVLTMASRWHIHSDDAPRGTIATTDFIVSRAQERPSQQLSLARPT